MSLVDMDLPPAAFITLIGLMKSIAGILLIVTGIGYMAAIIPVIIAFLYAFQIFYLRTSRQLRYIDLEAKSPLYTHILETVQGLSTIRAFGWSSANLASSLKFLDISQHPYYLLYCVQRWLNLVLDLFVAGVAVVLVAIAVSVTNVTGAGAIAVGLLSFLKLNSSLTATITMWTELETSLGAIARLKNLEDDTPKEEEVDGISCPLLGGQKGEEWCLRMWKHPIREFDMMKTRSPVANFFPVLILSRCCETFL
jgi:ATP-binding cassette subfamily C (CFTR/MRP) protein 1